MLKKLKLFLLIFIPIALGLFARFQDLLVWLEKKGFYFYHGRAIFTGNDAFFFARYAEEFFSGKYKAGEIDYLRDVPDFQLYPDPVPLISVISGLISKIQGTYIENVSLWLVPVLAVLFSIPLVIFFKRIGFPIAGYSGAVFTVISLSYLPRTAIARLDTDSLNLFFPFVIPLFLLLFSQEEDKKKKYIHISLAGIFSYLYMWWYPKSALILSIISMFIIYLLIERKFRLSKDDLIGLGILIILSDPIYLLKGIGNLTNKVYSYVFLAGKKSVEGGFPNIQQWVAELQHYSFSKLAHFIAGNEIIFSIGLAGLLFILIIRWKPMILLIPFIVLGLIPLFGAMRFAMYLTPFIGVGFGAFIDYAIKHIKNRNEDNSKKMEFSLSVLAVVSILGLSLYLNKYIFSYVPRPKFPPPLAGDFLHLKEITEKNSWIWSWWSEGYMIEYYGERGVFVDPGSQFSPKTYFIGVSYSSPDPEQAKNTILSIATIGKKGIEEELKKGVSPEKIKEKVIKGEYIDITKIKHPIYWMFTIRSLPTFDGINRIGTWDFELKDGLKRQYQFLGNCFSPNKVTVVCNRWIVDLRRGLARSRVSTLPIQKVYFRTSKGEIRKGRYNQRGVNFLLISSKQGTFGFFMSDQALNTMFTKMFLLRVYDKEKFRLIYDNFPYSVIYRVKED